MSFPKPYADAVAKLRVPGGFILVAAFLWLSTPSRQSLAIGFPIAIAGLLLRGWAAGHLAKNTELASGGPYRFLRNPLYLGTLLAAAGLATAGRRWELAILFSAVFFLIYLPVIELEEQHLRKLFPSYAEYSARVPLLFPKWTGQISSQQFRWSLYKKNQEYQALLGFLAGAAFLIFRASA